MHRNRNTWRFLSFFNRICKRMGEGAIRIDMEVENGMTDNYDKQALMARELFLKYDWRAMAEKFGLETEGEYLYLRLLNRRYRISGESGVIEGCTEAGEEPCSTVQRYQECRDYDIIMALYDVLCYSKERPLLAGEWCALYNLQITMSSPNADLFTRKYAESFSGKTGQLQAACKKIGGREIGITAGADVCWEFDVFPFFPVQFRFWDGDEEFPAQIKLLWDKNSLRFLHFETLYYVMGILLEVLGEELNR